MIFFKIDSRRQILYQNIRLIELCSMGDLIFRSDYYFRFYLSDLT